VSRPAAPPGSPSDAFPRVLTVEEAAKILRISRGLAFNAVRNGDIPHLRIGRRILIPEHGLKALVGAGGTSAAGEPASNSGHHLEREDGPGEDKLAALRELATALETLIAASQPDRGQRGGR